MSITRYSALALGFAWTTSAVAVPFNLGAFEGQLDSTLTFGMAWGLQHPSAGLVGVGHGGSAPLASRDDGRRLFGAGETFSKRLEGVHALELKRGDSGVYLKGHYWYDFELADEQPIDDHGRDEHVRTSGGEFLDAFVYRNYRLGDDRAGSLRLGRQTLRWGEGVFIGGGLDAIDPRDAAALHTPTSERREGALPVELAYLSQQLTDTLDVEAFYQWRWRHDEAENCGTFFAQLAAGCHDDLQVAVPGGGTRSVGRAADREARDGGQFGVALRYYAASLDTDVAAYALNYHSRAAVLGLMDADRYVLGYPEDIHLYGLSFSSSPVSGTTWRGELSYRPNAPVQQSFGDLLDAGVASDGYDRRPLTQVQTSLTQLFDRFMGAQRMTLTGELGWVRVSGLDTDLHYGRDPAFGSSAQAGGGFTTRDAWGYRLRAVWDYPGAWAGLDLHPSLGWAQDVNGYSPEPEGTFVEGRKAVTLGLDLDARRTWKAGVAYTNFFSGRYSTWRDRDFLAFNVGVSF